MKKNTNKTIVIALLALTALLTAGGAAGITALITSSETTTNETTIGTVLGTITVNASTSSATIQNTGNDSVFLRVYAADEDGNRADTLGNGWTYVSIGDDSVLGDYFYYTTPLEAGATTTALSLSSGKEIIVYEEVIQTTGEDSTDYTGANAWRNAWTAFLS